MDLLLALGVRSVPVVSRGKDYVFAQRLQDVADFVGVDVAAGPVLSPEELVGKINHVLGAAKRYVRQIPDDKLDQKLPNRNRTYRELGHHIFRVVQAFLEATEGDELVPGKFAETPTDEIRTGEDIAVYGEDIHQRVTAWWAGCTDRAGEGLLPTYYGEQRMHDVLERTAWHSAQHVRQMMMVLEGLGIAPDRPLTADILAGLPLPEKVWDE
jgi:hypothetical protein